MSLFTAQIHSQEGALGFFVLGASLHDILTRLKSEPLLFPKIDLLYSPQRPVTAPVILTLPSNGIRLRFDGQEQRLRLIEVTDFSKNKLSRNNVYVAKAATTTSAGLNEPSTGPTFKHVYRDLMGPTFAGEYMPAAADDESGMGLYILSYLGVAFSFPLPASTWSPTKSYVSILSAPTTLPAASMAIYNGDSWADARENLYARSLPYPRSSPLFAKGRDLCPEEVVLARIQGEGVLELVRTGGAATVATATAPFTLLLNETTPQDLVAELGPPDAIYRRSGQKMAIHNTTRTADEATRQQQQQQRRRQRQQPSTSQGRDESPSDTDQSSAHATTDDSDEDEDDVADGGFEGPGGTAPIEADCFYNYFYHGFDILISTPSAPSRRPPSHAGAAEDSSPRASAQSENRGTLVATKIILHSNVPGSYPFNRHRRCRWEIDYLSSANRGVVNSETPFPEVAERLSDEWKSIYASSEDAKLRQRGMVLNRGWGDDPGSSCEMLGGWEESAGGKRSDITGAALDEDQGLGNTTLYGFPGLVFEVLRNGTVSGLTVF